MFASSSQRGHDPQPPVSLVILLRESYREEDSIRMLANLNHWSPDKIAALRAKLTNQFPKGDLKASSEVTGSHTYGQVVAVLATLRNLDEPSARAGSIPTGHDLKLVGKVFADRYRVAPGCWPRAPVVPGSGLVTETSISLR